MLRKSNSGPAALITIALLAALAVLPSGLAQQNCDRYTEASACTGAGCHWCAVVVRKNGALTCQDVAACSALPGCTDVPYGSLPDFYRALPADKNNGEVSLEFIEVEEDSQCKTPSARRPYFSADCESCIASSNAGRWCNYVAKFEGEVVAQGANCELTGCEPGYVSTHVASPPLELIHTELSACPTTTTTTATTSTSAAQPTTKTAGPPLPKAVTSTAAAATGPDAAANTGTAQPASAATTTEAEQPTSAAVAVATGAAAVVATCLVLVSVA